MVDFALLLAVLFFLHICMSVSIIIYSVFVSPGGKLGHSKRVGKAVGQAQAGNAPSMHI